MVFHLYRAMVRPLYRVPEFWRSDTVECHCPPYSTRHRISRRPAQPERKLRSRQWGHISSGYGRRRPRGLTSGEHIIFIPIMHESGIAQANTLRRAIFGSCLNAERVDVPRSLAYNGGIMTACARSVRCLGMQRGPPDPIWVTVVTARRNCQDTNITYPSSCFRSTSGLCASSCGPLESVRFFRCNILGSSNSRY
jgi:hypothetical protein